MKPSNSFIAGFLILFFIYHFPEFFQSFWITALFKIGFLIVAIILCRLQGWKGLEGYGLSFNKKWYLVLASGLLIGFGAFVSSILISIGIQFEQIENIQSIEFFLQSIPLTLLMTFFPSIAEDILTRGYLYGHLKLLKPTIWILLSSTIYVLNHIWRLNDGIPVLSYLFLLGVVLAISVLAKRSLWLALGIHWGANIAYELSNSGLKLNSVSNKPETSTWPLAIVWGFTSLILLFMYRRQLKNS
ncbi:CPBP family glutamic-type intramembrane protease [Flavihumibacter sp. RY-1]|uniref:CPBP family glutamic-type intramembrane protease n=1 Tax=Flavihumibacter fluminis TaxID=2909236 RepID=A0ABS9BEW5_9BACT|nr:type II CAAX endopeptidase family protein [Flavihumibacter fluminis]MCF1713688.1 CPBP family glutamic-type intramembrane protease [Flavihumibacter fluminis]